MVMAKAEAESESELVPQMWAVLSSFVCSEGTSSTIESVHDSQENAVEWARVYCMNEYGEAQDVSNSPDVHVCNEEGTPVYSSEWDAWECNVYYVQKLPSLTRGPPEELEYGEDESL